MVGMDKYSNAHKTADRDYLKDRKWCTYILYVYHNYIYLRPRGYPSSTKLTFRRPLRSRLSGRPMDVFVISRCYRGATVYPKKYAHGFCFAVLCCGYTLTDFPISIRLTSLALWQSNDCPSASKATLMNMDKYFMWIHYERLHNHNKAKHNKTVCIFLGIYCMFSTLWWLRSSALDCDISIA